MLSLITLLVAFGSLEAKITQLTWRDCDADPNRPIKFQELSVSPVPLVNPGEMHLHAKAVITKPIPKFQLKLDINRHTFLGNIHIPCTNGLGSCALDGCTVISVMKASASQAEQDMGGQIEQLFNDLNFNYHCPIPAQTLDIGAKTFTLPKMGLLAKLMGDGDYTIEARMLNPDSGELYGCLTFDIAIKSTCIGWACHG